MELRQLLEMAERADPKKPYGDVSYADPGYQADGKKRYPLDSEEHCRAAWSYINMPKNAAKYTPEQLARIKSRIKAAGRRYGIEFADSRCDAMPAVETRGFDLELRSAKGDGRTLEGYVAVFGATARIADRYGDFDEEIHRGAFDESLQRSMPVMQFDHGKDPRTGTLPIGVYETFEPDARGYYVRGRLIDDPLVEPIRKAIEMKAIRGMSWRMMVPKDGQQWSPNGAKRDVIKASVPEAGPVVFPAYDATTVSVRNLLAAFSAEERAALVRELADEVALALDLTGRPGAGSAGGGDRDVEPREGDTSNPLNNSRTRQLLLTRPALTLPVKDRK